METADILGVKVTLAQLAQVLHFIDRTVSAGGRARIAYVHAMGLNMAYEQGWLRDFFNATEITYCDGMGVKLAGRLLGYDIHRFTLADWMGEFASLALVGDYSFYFLGNPPGAASKAADRLSLDYPGIRILGTEHGYFEKTAGHHENEAVIARINQVQPHILMVGFGTPVQERWLLENWERLDVNLGIAVGGLFEILSGDLRRGPRWMTDHYLEWLAHLLVAPRRFFKRYLIGNPLFLYRVFRQRLGRNQSGLLSKG